MYIISDKKPASKFTPKAPHLRKPKDDDYSPTVSERKKKDALRRFEQQQLIKQQKMESSELSEKELSKALRSRRETLTGKIRETDSVCACKSFLLIINSEKEVSFFHGHPDFVSKFFSTGISAKIFNKEVRMLFFFTCRVSFSCCFRWSEKVRSFEVVNHWQIIKGQLLWSS